MTGLPVRNYPAFFQAEERLVFCGYTVLNPARIDEQWNVPWVDHEWDWYMRHALRMVLEAEGLALLDGWNESVGAKLENHVSKALCIPVYPVAGWELMAREKVEGAASPLSQASRDSNTT